MGWQWLESLLGKKTEEVIKEPNIQIFNTRVDINGNYEPQDLAMTLYLIHIGEYATLMITALKLKLEQDGLSKEDKEIYLNKFTQAYQTLISTDKAIKQTFSTKPVVRPIEAFK